MDNLNEIDAIVFTTFSNKTKLTFDEISKTENKKIDISIVMFFISKKPFIDENIKVLKKIKKIYFLN